MKYKLLIISVLCVSNLFGQQRVLPPTEKVISVDSVTGLKIFWTDSDLYGFAKEYNLQDSLFINPTTIKKGYTLLKAYPKIEVDRYLDQTVKSMQRRRAWAKYENEAKQFHANEKSIKNSFDYLQLLNKYPLYKTELIKYYSQIPDYANFENGLKTGEIRIGRLPEIEGVVLVLQKYEDSKSRHKTLPIK